MISPTCGKKDFPEDGYWCFETREGANTHYRAQVSHPRVLKQCLENDSRTLGATISYSYAWAGSLGVRAH